MLAKSCGTGVMPSEIMWTTPRGLSQLGTLPFHVRWYGKVKPLPRTGRLPSTLHHKRLFMTLDYLPLFTSGVARGSLQAPARHTLAGIGVGKQPSTANNSAGESAPSQYTYLMPANRLEINKKRRIP
jgi:hypothetical protein